MSQAGALTHVGSVSDTLPRPEAVGAKLTRSHPPQGSPLDRASPKWDAAGRSDLPVRGSETNSFGTLNCGGPVSGEERPVLGSRTGPGQPPIGRWLPIGATAAQQLVAPRAFLHNHPRRYQNKKLDTKLSLWGSMAALCAA